MYTLSVSRNGRVLSVSGTTVYFWVVSFFFHEFASVDSNPNSLCITLNKFIVRSDGSKNHAVHTDGPRKDWGTKDSESGLTRLWHGTVAAFNVNCSRFFFFFFFFFFSSFFLQSYQLSFKIKATLKMINSELWHSRSPITTLLEMRLLPIQSVRRTRVTRSSLQRSFYFFFRNAI